MSRAACRSIRGVQRRVSLTGPGPYGKRTCTACEERLVAAAATGHTQARASSSSSRWKMRQGKDIFAREAKVQGLKSRAAFKLLEMDAKYRIFRKGQTVVDLGYAPGSWSQVAAERTKPNGQILGIDIIPAQPPKSVSTIQGNFLSPEVQAMVKDHLVRAKKRRAAMPSLPTSPPPPPSPPPSSPPPQQQQQSQRVEEEEQEEEEAEQGEGVEGFETETETQADAEAETGGGDGEADAAATAAAVIEDKPSYIDMERAASEARSEVSAGAADGKEGRDVRLVDIVLSDMMMNTSGMAFRDHARSMDLCTAALQFASDTLKNGGHFVCKFYQGSEDKAFEKKLRGLFARVHREKPESSRSDSKEAYFVALRRKGNARLQPSDES